MYKATLRVLLADKNIDKSEMASTKEAMEFLGIELNLNTVMELINDLDGLLPISEANYSYEVAFAIANQCLVATAMDSVLSKAEIAELTNVLKLLDFNSTAVQKMLEWGLSLSRCYAEGSRLKASMHQFHAQIPRIRR